MGRGGGLDLGGLLVPGHPPPAHGHPMLLHASTCANDCGQIRDHIHSSFPTGTRGSLAHHREPEDVELGQERRTHCSGHDRKQGGMWLPSPSPIPLHNAVSLWEDRGSALAHGTSEATSIPLLAWSGHKPYRWSPNDALLRSVGFGGFRGMLVWHPASPSSCSTHAFPFSLHPRR